MTLNVAAKRVFLPHNRHGRRFAPSVGFPSGHPPNAPGDGAPAPYMDMSVIYDDSIVQETESEKQQDMAEVA